MVIAIFGIYQYVGFPGCIGIGILVRTNMDLMGSNK